ncbi:uncharacterized protein LOC113360157 [Papaver somniferum]|uniref:uncharacterized protein LOC113360157 n=1 Tax=Papaver somniferum TaxID=3469 RepID=UPI000E6FBA8E|nr:uncharacterized protein LOC113360157 [Papaver somniferum]
MVLLLYVDDIILTGNSEDLLNDLVNYLSNNFVMKELGDLHYFLGLEAIRSSDAIMLTEKKYILELLAKSHMLECNPCSTTVPKGPRVSVNEGTLLSNATKFRTTVGMLQYFSLTRPDICFRVNYASQYMHAPNDIHLLLVKIILRYFEGTIGYGITLRKGDVECSTAYTDSDWGSFPETARSTCGYTIFMGNSLISWSSKKHPTVSRSTTEAEYKCLSAATAELEWLGSLFSELHITLKKPITLYCDNTNAIYLSANLVSHSRAKHIKIHYHVVRELIEEGFLTVQHISSENQLADLFTKGLCAPIFTSLLHQSLELSSSDDTTSSASTTSTSSAVTDLEETAEFSV